MNRRLKKNAPKCEYFQQTWYVRDFIIFQGKMSVPEQKTLEEDGTQELSMIVGILQFTGCGVNEPNSS